MSAKDAPRIKWLVEPHFDQDGVQSTAGLDQYGREQGDNIPLSPPVGLAVAQGDELHTAIRNIFLKERNAFQAAVQAEDFETEEEANDFLCAEDLFPPGNEPWEDIFEFPAEPAGEVANGPTLASGAVKGGSRGPEEPTPPATANRTVSLDQSGRVLKESLEQTRSLEEPPVLASGDSRMVDKRLVDQGISRQPK